ncbi:hypothetical protein BB558_006709 [Smittium angustum]|uniref:Fork-head domain-containing protein n=1 Tax=Smittium angustum TaxID=133377 RepID=A0A2U1IX19_SMIAN|nr:hypothetical protein BB558_006709 [Smittium angustum]
MINSKQLVLNLTPNKSSFENTNSPAKKDIVDHTPPMFTSPGDFSLHPSSISEIFASDINTDNFTKNLNTENQNEGSYIKKDFLDSYTESIVNNFISFSETNTDFPQDAVDSYTNLKINMNELDKDSTEENINNIFDSQSNANNSQLNNFINNDSYGNPLDIKIDTDVDIKSNINNLQHDEKFRRNSDSVVEISGNMGTLENEDNNTYVEEKINDNQEDNEGSDNSDNEENNKDDGKSANRKNSSSSGGGVGSIDVGFLLDQSASLKSATSGKLPYSYATLITYAILRHPKGKMTLNEIYSWIIEKYPHFKNAGNGWKNSIRHNLSLNKTFVRVPRPINQPGKGAYWAVDMKVLNDSIYMKNRNKRNPSDVISNINFWPNVNRWQNNPYYNGVNQHQNYTPSFPGYNNTNSPMIPLYQNTNSGTKFFNSHTHPSTLGLLPMCYKPGYYGSNHQQNPVYGGGNSIMGSGLLQGRRNPQYEQPFPTTITPLSANSNVGIHKHGNMYPGSQINKGMSFPNESGGENDLNQVPPGYNSYYQNQMNIAKAQAISRAKAQFQINNMNLQQTQTGNQLTDSDTNLIGGPHIFNLPHGQNHNAYINTGGTSTECLNSGSVLGDCMSGKIGINSFESGISNQQFMGMIRDSESAQFFQNTHGQQSSTLQKSSEDVEANGKNNFNFERMLFNGNEKNTTFTELQNGNLGKSGDFVNPASLVSNNVQSDVTEMENFSINMNGDKSGIEDSNEKQKDSDPTHQLLELQKGENSYENENNNSFLDVGKQQNPMKNNQVNNFFAATTNLSERLENINSFSNIVMNGIEGIDTDITDIGNSDNNRQVEDLFNDIIGTGGGDWLDRIF